MCPRSGAYYAQEIFGYGESWRCDPILNAKILNLPNALSLVRVFLAPLVLLFLSIRISGALPLPWFLEDADQIGRASCRERV